MKGTARREGVPELDDPQLQRLTSSAKERAENVMIVDMVRNDLSRIAKERSVHVVSLCEVERFPQVFQMVSEVRATTEASLSDVISAMFPCASITGAPKARTMQIIKQREHSARGLYTGSLAIVTPEDRAWLNVAIRTAVVDQKTGAAEFGVGSGVVWDSECSREYTECLLKAHVISNGKPRPELFETLLWDGSRGYRLLQYHVERLLHSALEFGYPCEKSRVLARLQGALEELHTRDGPLRVRIFLDALGAIATEIGPVPNMTSPYRVALAREPIFSGDYRLRHKSTDRSLYDSAEPSIDGVDDVILWNERGEITESRIANVIVTIEGDMYTPPLSSGVLPGCLRRDLLARQEITERTITKDEMLRSDRVYLANSLRGVWCVELAVAYRDGVCEDPRHVG